MDGEMSVQPKASRLKTLVADTRGKLYSYSLA